LKEGLQLSKNGGQARGVRGVLHEDKSTSQTAESLIVIHQSSSGEVGAGQDDPEIQPGNGQEGIEAEAESAIE
jgi:hypothetical protein